MATECNVEMNDASLQNPETLSPLSSQPDCLISSDFEIPQLDLIDFDMLIDKPANETAETAEVQEVSCEASESEDSKKRKHTEENPVSFLDLLDDIFGDEKSMETVNSPLERIEELLHCRLAGSPETKRQKTSDDDECFAKPTTYSCHYCSKIFYSSIQCRNHQVHHTKSLLQCSWCNKQCRSNSGLKRHIQYYHQYSSMCNVFFDSR